MQDFGPPPKNWLVEAILVTVFCCLPFGIVSIIHSSKVNTLWAAGDYEGAERAAADAKKWCMYSLIAFGFLMVLYIILFLVAGVGAVWLDRDRY